MSASIDQRIVSMKFDNNQFQNGVSDSLKSINDLKKGLEFSGASKGLDSIGTAANKLSFSGLSSGLESVKAQFSALQVVAVTALVNISNSAINTGKQLISSLTVDPIMDGFREYETQMNSIQTILANTSSKGTTLEQVKAALAELNTYSDKTIYNFTEMTRNIGTFTAAGISLDKSTSAIKGIANLAAMSGSNSEQASTAMYQLSQALAAGSVKLQDWNSVVNAGMGGEVFQNALKETARVHGVAVDKIIKGEGSFRESLQKGWITSEIMTETLSKFTGDLSAAQLKTMGYTDKQIEGIMKMAQTANDAATKVKTITQLIDTLKEAVGSGWAQTWQTVFGDFEEAKVLFTNVSNVLGGMIGTTAEARNEMLKGWKDLGGRKALIDSIATAFNSVMSIVGSVSKAFRDVFPATTSQQLFNLTNGLKNLAEYLKPSDAMLYNLRSTFKGLFAILDIGKTILLAVGNAISIIIGGTGGLITSVLGATGSFGEWVTALDNTIKKSDVFNKVLTTLAYGIKNGLGGVVYVFDKIGNGIQYIFNLIKDNVKFPAFVSLGTVLELIGNKMESIGNGADNMAMAVGGAFMYMGDAVSKSKIGEIFISIWNTVKMVAGAIGNLVEKLVTAVSDAIKNANFSSMLDAVAAMSIGGMLLAFKKFMGSLKDALGESTGLFSNIKGVLDDVRGSFEAYQQNLKAGVLIKLGIAISLLAASIVAISLIDSGKLVSSLAAIGTLFAQLLVAMKLYTLIGDFKVGVVKSSIVMMTMATSILILSSAMRNLSTLDWGGLARGVVGVASLAGILVTSAKILSSGSKAMFKGSAGMVVFAAAIKILASACVTLSKLNWEELKIGLIGVGALLGEIALFLRVAKFNGKMILTATGIVILAEAIKILASAVSDFAVISWTDIEKGLKSIGALLAEITVFSKLNGNSANLILTATGMTILGSAMKIFASAISDFGSMNWEVISAGLKAMALTLLEVTVAMKLMPNNTILIGTGLVVVATAMDMLASAIIKMGGTSWEDLSKGLKAMGGALAILAIGLNVMKGTLAGSAALLVAAGALAILAPALLLLGSMTWTSIVKGLVDLAAVIAIFGLSALVLTPIIPSILALSGALVLLGISMLGIGAGLALVGVGLAGVATGFMALAGVTTVGASAIVASLSIIVAGVAALIPTILAKVGEGIVALLKVISDSMPAIVEAISVIIKAVVDCIATNAPVIINGIATILIGIINAIATNTPPILDGIFKILIAILDAIIKWTPTIVQKFCDMILAMLGVVANNIGKFVSAGVDIVVAFLNGVANNLQRVIDAAFNLIIKFVNGLADAIRSNSGALANAGYNLATAVIDAVGNLHGRMVDVGIYAVEGFINGLLSIPGKIWAAGSRIGQKALDAAKAALDSHSPSREFMALGEFSGQGFIIGLDSYNKKVGQTSYGIGTTAVDSMSNAISGISDIVNSNLDSSPVIRPVLDLTDVVSGTNNIGSLLNGNYNIDTSSTSSKVSSLGGVIDSSIQNGNSITDIVMTNIDRLNKSVGKLQEMFANEQPIYLTNITNLDSKVIAQETVPLVSNRLALNVNMRR